MQPPELILTYCSGPSKVESPICLSSLKTESWRSTALHKEGAMLGVLILYHDNVIKWKHFPRYWPFVRGIHLSPVNSPHKGQWRGALILLTPKRVAIQCARYSRYARICFINQRMQSAHFQSEILTHTKYMKPFAFRKNAEYLWLVRILRTST